MYGFYQCPDCGANLDPGERCDCEKEKIAGTNRESEKNNEAAVENNQPDYGCVAI